MSTSRTATAERTVETCTLCAQSVPPEEMLTLETDHDEQTLCVFCARSLFDAETGTAQVRGTDQAVIEPERTSDTQRDSAPATGERARDVTWAPPRPRRVDGLGETLVATHRLSLSLLWAIHRTNVRLLERLLDETDVQTLLVLIVTLATAATVALGALAAAGP
ncbi:hypothetical protein [Halosegnis sp.]|uniref:hypothetical protein n=1 Tax=Halosegnis sp. TaxID=2864959 RepID=UPI0035D4E11D